MSDGETPLILEACPIVKGPISLSFCLPSVDIECSFSNSKFVGSPNTIIKELKLKDYLGVPLPVFDMHSFGSAFDMAVEKYGSSKEKRFWWRGNVYTTEKK